MIYIFHGKNEFMITQAIKKLEELIQPDDALEANRHRLTGPGLTLKKLQSVCSGVPFLAPYRLVTVDGYLSRISINPGRTHGSRTSGNQEFGQEWERLCGYLETVPPTTILVFVDELLRHISLIKKRLISHADIREFPNPTPGQLNDWIAHYVDIKGALITRDAIKLLNGLIGNNLRMIASELDKLILSTGREPITEYEIQTQVAEFRQASIFRAIDSIFEGRPGEAMRIVQTLSYQETHLATTMINLLARQLRLLVLAHEYTTQGMNEKEMAKQLDISHMFVLQKILQQARHLNNKQLFKIYHRLAQIDLDLKRGMIKETWAPILLILELKDLVHVQTINAHV